MMAVVFAAAVFTLPNIKAARKIAIDWPSFVLSFVGMGLFLAGISTVQEAPLVGVSMMVAGLLFVAWFARRQWSSAQPLLNLRLLKGATFRRMTVGVMLAFGVFLGTETIIPVLLESHAGRSGFATALVMLPGAVSNVIASPLTGRVFDARGLRTIWAWGWDHRGVGRGPAGGVTRLGAVGDRRRVPVAGGGHLGDECAADRAGAEGTHR